MRLVTIFILFKAIFCFIFTHPEINLISITRFLLEENKKRVKIQSVFIDGLQ